MERLRVYVNELQNKFEGVIVLAEKSEGKAFYIVKVPIELTKKINANELIKYMISPLGGKGGGNKELAQGSSSNESDIPIALENAKTFLGKII